MTLIVERATGLITIQDAGRPGRMHEALPPGGALVPELLAIANRAVYNPDPVAAIEVIGRLTVRAEAAMLVATDAAGARLLGPGEALEVSSEPRRVAYLAVRGGIDAPIVLGGRGAQLSAGIGTLVRAGARFAAGEAPDVEPFSTEPFAAEGPVRVIGGPDLDAFEPAAVARLLAAAYRISPTSDRVGTRLEGPPIPRRAGPEVSRPMVRGAIEVPSDGQPIVLGPEHPTTGGYPILAVIAHADLGRFFAIRPGGTVRFTAA
ncbi:MAG: biotin-dependent carboxyltransferase family protein [Kofleriaceae bacterium]